MSKQKDLQKQIDEAWLGLSGINDDELFNPMEFLKASDQDYHLKLTWLITQPQNFSFLCKHILNIDILPSQALILNELWSRRFPMLIASRGFGKALRPDELIRVRGGWKTMKDLQVGDQVYGGDGELTNVVQKTAKQTGLKMYRITLRDGRTIECCEDHTWKVWDKSKNKNQSSTVWSEIQTKDMVKDYFYTRKGKKSIGKEYKYALPINEAIEEDEKQFDLHPYILGVVLGDGCISQDRVVITTQDSEIIDRVSALLPSGYKVSKLKDKYSYSIIKDGARQPFIQYFKDLDLYQTTSKTKFIPDIYKYGSISQRLELLKGLMDTDGYSNGQSVIEYYTISNRLSEDFLDICRSLGIHCKHTSRQAWYQGQRYNDCNRITLYTQQEVFSLERKLKYLQHTISKQGQSKYEKVFITKIEHIGDDGEGYCIKVDNEDHTYITKDYIVTHNSFMLSLYAILRALLLPKRKIIIVGAAFRQSKVLFEYMENIWNNSPILRSMCTQNCGPRREVDRCVLRIHDSRIICLPLGDGCLSEGTMVTYKDSFGYIEKTMGSIWGNKKFRDIDVPHDNGIKDTLTIKTKMGFEYSGTLNHKMRIVRDSKIIWCRTDEMKTGDRILIDRSHRWHDGEMSDVNLDQCYALGAMIGDGNYTNKYRLRFATKDNEIIERINSSFVNKNFYQCRDKTHWNLDSKNEVTDWLNLWGMDSTYTIDKKIPDKAMSASREQMTEILKGLFDTDGFVTHSESRGSSTYVGFTNTSKTLVQQIQYILLHYGIVAKMYRRNRHQDWNTSYELLITGNDAYKFKNLIGFHLKRKSDVLQYAKKTKTIIDGVPVDKHLVMSFVSNDGATVSPSIVNRKKTLTHSFLKDIINKSNKSYQEWFELVDDDIYYDIVTDISKTKHHTYDMHVPDGNEYCANGFFSHNSKIRGQRANDILADEFACLKEGSLVETESGFIRVEDFDSARKLKLPTGDNDTPYESPSKFIKTPKTDVYEIKLQNGYVIRCSKDHKVMTNHGWKQPLELTSDDWLEQSPNINNNFGEGVDGLDEKMAWLIGLLISEGSITDKSQLQITNTDIKLIEKLVNDYGWNFYSRNSYTDERGWKCKKSYVAYISDKMLRDKLYEWGIGYVSAHDKQIPWSILQSSKSVIKAFLSGLFEGDGSCFLWKDRDVYNRLGLAYYSVSERLCRDVQVLMNKLGYDGYINSRDSKISNNKQWFVRWNGKCAKGAAEWMNIQRFKDPISKCVDLQENTHICWDKSRKKWKVQFKYIDTNFQKRFNTYGDAENFVNKMKSKPKFRKVISVKKLDEKEHLYDYYLPITHSFYAEGHRQHNSIPRDIFETVVVGFGAVASNPIENVKRIAAEKLAKELDFDLELDEENVKMHDKANQMILSGTAYYDFNHFASYWKNWHKIINSKGDEKRLKEVFGDEDEPPKDFSWKDYSIIRIPYELLPEGFMDAAQVARSKATIHNGIYQMEYGAVFTSDSQGFFKRSLIESCVASEDNRLLDYKNRPIIYDPMLIGDHNKRYIFGIDPASEVDNFSIVVIELNEDHKRIVYCWTTTRSQHREKLKKGYCTETAFYDYCARKIRDLMRLFPCIHIAMDKQGGGVAVMEALHDKDKLQQGEIPIWPVIDPDKEADTDDEKGLHILELCNNSQLDWYIEANHGLRKDFEDKSTLFPQYDALSVSLSNVQDSAKGRMFDTMEECVLEIQELKDELSMIQMTQTANGRDRWDTPEVIVGAGKKEKMRKDRYSALMMANMAARTLMRMPTQADYDFYGGFATLKDDLEIDPDQDLYNGPNWFTDGMRDIY